MGEPSSPAKSALTGETASHPHAVDRTGASELALTNLINLQTHAEEQVRDQQCSFRKLFASLVRSQFLSRAIAGPLFALLRPQV